MKPTVHPRSALRKAGAHNTSSRRSRKRAGGSAGQRIRRDKRPAWKTDRELGQFGRALAHLHEGKREPRPVLLQLLEGPDGRNTEADEVLVDRCMRVAQFGRVDAGFIDDSWAGRRTRNTTTRGILCLIVRLWSRLKRLPDGKGFAVEGRAAFWGLQWQECPVNQTPPPCCGDEIEGIIAELEREEREERDAEKAAQETAAAPRPKRLSVPKGKQGGLARSICRHVRTLGRWARLLREAGIVVSSKVPAEARDARRTRNGRAYPKWSLIGSPTRGLMHALRVLWDEVKPRRRETKKAAERRAAPVLERKADKPTGPPPPDPFLYDSSAVADGAAQIMAAVAARKSV